MSRRTSTAVARLPGAGGSPWTAAPRTCENAPAATGRRCRPARRAGGSASCARPQTNRPKTADRTRSTLVVSAFAERRRAAAGVQRSRWQRLGDRSAGVERIESQTKGGLACALIVRPHPLSGQLVTSGQNNGDEQVLANEHRLERKEFQAP